MEAVKADVVERGRASFFSAADGRNRRLKNWKKSTELTRTTRGVLLYIPSFLLSFILPSSDWIEEKKKAGWPA